MTWKQWLHNGVQASLIPIGMGAMYLTIGLALFVVVMAGVGVVMGFTWVVGCVLDGKCVG